MIYQMDNIRKEVEIKDIQLDHMYIGIMGIEELKEKASILGILPRAIERCEDSSMLNQNVIIPHKAYYYGSMSLINERDIFIKKDKFAFFIFKHLFLVVVLEDEDQHIEEVFKYSCDYVVENGVSITRLVYYFFSELMAKDHRYIEELQEEIEGLETDNHDDHFVCEVRMLNKELLLLLNYYENLTIIGEELQINHYNMFDIDDMRYFEIFTRRIERLSSGVNMLKELLNQAREMHQAHLDYKMNKTMQLFTVVTTIFLPLTLLTGWYGMNFKYMPELNSPYGYISIIGIGILIVCSLVYWFKKKKYF